MNSNQRKALREELLAAVAMLRLPRKRPRTKARAVKGKAKRRRTKGGAS